MGFLGQAAKVFRRSRWGEYRAILEAALKNGYRLMTVQEWTDAGPARAQLKAMVLRHDVDSLPWSALGHHQVEMSLGVKSTHYFRWETADPEVIALIRRDGSEIGLHHEALRFAAIRRGITRPEGMTEEVIAEAASSLEQQILAFESLFGPIRTIASHGSREHRSLKLTDAMLVERLDPDLRRRITSAYNPELVDVCDYISDCGPPEFWRYGHTPLQAIARGQERIYFLSHPEHWEFSPAAKLWRTCRRLTQIRVNRMLTVQKDRGRFKITVDAE
jgi:hypothetical protein